MPDGSVSLPDFVAVLRSVDDPPRRLTKRIYRGEDGNPAIEDYEGAYLFDMEHRVVGGLADLKDIVDSLSPHECIVTGAVTGGVWRTAAQRLKNGSKATLAEARHNWLPIDAEGFVAVDVAGEFDYVREPERAVALAISKLPPEFHDIGCVWQLTSGAGFKDNVRLRLYFWLHEPRSNAEIKAWLAPYLLSRKNKDNPTRFVDGSIYSAEHVIYAARPVLDDGIADPVPRRSGIIRGVFGDRVVPPAAVAVPERPKLDTPPGFTADSPRAIHEAYREVQRWQPAVDGNRNHSVAALAAKLHGIGVSEGVAVETIEEAYLPYGAAPDEPVEYIVASAYRSAQNGAGSELPKTGAEVFAGYVPAEGEETKREGGGDRPKHPRINLLRISDIRALPDPIELVEGMLVDRENVAIVSEPKAGKTFLAIEMALSLAAQIPVLGHYAVRRKGHVIYLSGEGHAGMKRRIMAWGKLRGNLSEAELDALPFHYNKGVPLTQEGIAEAKAFIEEVKRKVAAEGGVVVLAVLDTMARSLGGLDENAASTAAEYLNLTEALRDGLDCTVLTLAHATNKEWAKRTGASTDFRGSSGFSGGFDSVWTLDKDEGTRTVELKGKWFKEHDERPSVYFKLEPSHLGAVLKLVPPPPPKAKGGANEKAGHDREARVRTILAAGGHYGWKNGLPNPEMTERLVVEREGDRPHDDLEAERRWDTENAKEGDAVRNATRAAWGKSLGSEECQSGGTRLTWRWHLPEADDPSTAVEKDDDIPF